MLEIFRVNFVIDDLHVTNGIYLTFLMNHIFVLETSNNMKDAINRLDIGQECIAKTFSFASSLD